MVVINQSYISPRSLRDTFPFNAADTNQHHDHHQDDVADVRDFDSRDSRQVGCKIISCQNCAKYFHKLHCNIFTGVRHQQQQHSLLWCCLILCWGKEVRSQMMKMMKLLKLRNCLNHEIVISFVDANIGKMTKFSPHPFLIVFKILCLTWLSSSAWLFEGWVINLSQISNFSHVKLQFNASNCHTWIFQ